MDAGAPGVGWAGTAAEGGGSWRRRDVAHSTPPSAITASAAPTSQSGILRPGNRGIGVVGTSSWGSEGGESGRGIGTGSGATAVRSSSPVRREGVGVFSAAN